MSTLAARLALSAAGVVVVLTGVEALRWRHPQASAMPPVPEEPVAEPPPAPPRFAPSFARVPARKPVPQRVRHGPFAMARIHGRVVGSAAALDRAEVSVEDEKRAYEPSVDDDGTFEIHLPPGSYAVAASSGSLVAMAEVVDLAPDEDRQVALVLAESVTIQGRVEGCDGPCGDASIHVVTSGSQVLRGDTQSDGQGEFVIAGLVPGQAYDLTFEVSERRELTLRGLSAPARDVVATMEPRGTLAGGFGIEPGQDCPMRTVELEGLRGGDDWELAFDPNCRFRFEGLPAATNIHLRASGEGWHFSIDVALPEHGDPPFLCLRAPCREPEAEVIARLAVIVADGPGRAVFVRATLPDPDEHKVTVCHEASAPCVLDDLRARPGVSVVVDAIGCETRTYTLNLLPGPNYLTSPCESVRLIRGIIHGATASTRIRCSNRDPARPGYGRGFVLQCSERRTTIEYQLEESGPWQTVPVVSPQGNRLALVEIRAA